MIVCIDTNVLLQAAKSGHRYEIIIKEWLNRRFQWAVSTSILAEYREVITQRSGARRWHELERVFDLADQLGGLLIHGTPHYQFHVVTADPDDNKFTGCAITADADYVITDDRGFAPLADAGYKPPLFYKNGVVLSSAQKGSPYKTTIPRIQSNSTPLKLGQGDRNPPRGIHRLEGEVDEVRVYCRALSPNEIATLAGVPGP